MADIRNGRNVAKGGHRIETRLPAPPFMSNLVHWWDRMAQGVEANSVVANGASLYYERQGAGPAVFFIAGSTGDAGNFSRAATLLADEFTVVTYDRRGNSRSPHPVGWTTTSVGEQADDAVALIKALDLVAVDQL